MKMSSLFNKYKNLSKPVKASLWFVVSSVLLRGISFITLPIFSRLLSTEEYGTVSVYQSWVSIISIVTTLTIWGGIFNVEMTKKPEKRKELISSFQGISTTITISVLLISLPFLSYLSRWMRISELLVVLVFGEILVQIPFNLWATEQRYNYEYKKLILFTVIISISSPILGYYAVIFSPYKAEARIVTNFIIQAVFGIGLFLHNQIKGKKFFQREFWEIGFKFNIILIPHYLSTQILNQSDRIMIDSICGKSEAGIYSVAYTFAMLLSLLTSGINSSLTPHIYHSLKDGNTSKLSKQTTTVIIFVATICIALICFIPDIFMLLLPTSYYPALPVIPPVAAGAFFQFLYPLFGSVEFYYEENKYVTIASVIGAGLNIVLNYVFINLFGFIAAAYTTLFCYVCFSTMHYIFMRKIMKERGFEGAIYDTKKILLISLILILMTAAMQMLYSNNYVRWGVIVVIVLICLHKRNLIVSIVRELRSKNA